MPAKTKSGYAITSITLSRTLQAKARREALRLTEESGRVVSLSKLVSIALEAYLKQRAK